MKDISQNEIQLLNSILPENKSGYKYYRDLILKMNYAGEGRFGNGNFYLGNKNSVIDTDIPSAPVFAVGTVYTNLGSIDVLLHEYEDDMIEVQLSKRVDDNLELIINNSLNFSDWKCGDSSPGNSGTVKEVEIIQNEYTLVIDRTNRKIWLHSHATGVNHLIPVSNYFNEMMRLKKIKDENLFTNPSSFFENLDSYTEVDFKLAFYQYNKFMKRFKVKLKPEDFISVKRQKRSFLKIFSRG